MKSSETIVKVARFVSIHLDGW